MGEVACQDTSLLRPAPDVAPGTMRHPPIRDKISSAQDYLTEPRGSLPAGRSHITAALPFSSNIGGGTVGAVPFSRGGGHSRGGSLGLPPRFPRYRTKESPVNAENSKNLMLELVNKVEMFRIVTEKVNMQLVAKKKPAVFNLSDESER